MEGRQTTRIKKKAKQEKRLLVYVDEAAVRLLPSVHSTYAEVGKTPVLKDACKYTHLSVASAISEDGRLFYEVRQDSYNGNGIVLFLEKLLKESKQKLLVIWDGAKIHFSEAVQNFLDKQKGDKIWLAKTPAYSPELNADEQVWAYLKDYELKNVCCKNITELKTKTISALESIKKKKDIVQSFFRHEKVGFY